MTPAQPILHEESSRLERQYSSLIGRHNVLCSIEEVFVKNSTANLYFEKARDEVLESGNQSLASMFVIAIKNMAEYIKDNENEEDTDKDSLLSKIYSLESENRKLKMKLESITKAVNG